MEQQKIVLPTHTMIIVQNDKVVRMNSAPKKQLVLKPFS